MCHLASERIEVEKDRRIREQKGRRQPERKDSKKEERKERRKKKEKRLFFLLKEELGKTNRGEAGFTFGSRNPLFPADSGRPAY